MAGFGHLLHRLEKVAAGIGQQRRARRIEPSAILQFVLLIEAEEVGRALGTIGARKLLRLIDNVGKGKAMISREHLHIVEGVLANTSRCRSA